ncbi:MAG: hypothetical protein JO138_13090 [Acidobacteriaceae bacterium]|nr:hypothetical protein [Acidobacteriaceae bacterium]
MTVSAIAKLVGRRKTLGKEVETSSDLEHVTRAGLPVNIVNVVADELDTQRRTVAKLIGISERALSRRVNGNTRLTPRKLQSSVALVSRRQ